MSLTPRRHWLVVTTLVSGIAIGAGGLAVAAPGLGQRPVPQQAPSPPQLEGFVGITPVRVLDTRGPSNGPIGVSTAAPLGAGQRVDLALTTPAPNRPTAPVPAGATSAFLNITIDQQASTKSYLTVWPTGAPQPLTSANNAEPGLVSPNLTVIRLGTGGSVSFFNQQGSVDLAVDLVGYTVPIPVGSGQAGPPGERGARGDPGPAGAKGEAGSSQLTSLEGSVCAAGGVAGTVHVAVDATGIISMTCQVPAEPVNPSTCVDDFGNDPAHAFDVIPAQPVAGNLCDASDHDWFTVTLAQGHTMRITLTPAPSRDADFCVRNAAGAKLQCGDIGVGGVVETVDFQNIGTAAPFYVEVYAGSPRSDRIDYTLNVTLS